MIETFPVGSKLLNGLMAKLMVEVKRKPVLRTKLYQTNFHTTLSGEAVVTLIYHKKLDAEWTEAAEALRAELGRLVHDHGHKSSSACVTGLHVRQVRQWDLRNLERFICWLFMMHAASAYLAASTSHIAERISSDLPILTPWVFWCFKPSLED